jgi:hypothetical protein
MNLFLAGCCFTIIVIALAASIYLMLKNRKPPRPKPRSIYQRRHILVSPPIKPKPIYTDLPKPTPVYTEPAKPSPVQIKPAPPDLGQPIDFSKVPKRTAQKPAAQVFASDREVYLIKTLCRGEKDVALRLVTHLQLKHPERDRDWVIERAITDLERDRRVR